MNADQLLFRASSIGHIMTDPQGKTNIEKYNEAVTQLSGWREKHKGMKPELKSALDLQTKINSKAIEVEALRKTKDDVLLSETCKTHLVDLFVSKKYNRQTDIENRYIKKGLQVEEDSITLLSRVTKTFYKKNEERLNNEYITGLPDLFRGDSIHTADHITDIKSSWDIFTFFRTQAKGLNKMYYWQLQGYMALTGAKNATLAYCLVNTPDVMIEDEKRRMLWKMGVLTDQNPDYINACEELEASMRYDDIPMSERLYMIDIERNDADIEKMYQRVKDCRNWMNENLFMNIS